MTVEEFLALPEDGISRELVRGELREHGMTVRNRFQAQVTLRLSQHLANWLDKQTAPRGMFVAGEGGLRLRGTKDSLVGIDVAYVSAALLAATGERQNIFMGRRRWRLRSGRHPIPSKSSRRKSGVTSTWGAWFG
jgi:hypothetical protein